MSDLFNPLAPRIIFRGGRLLAAFRMRHEKHTQSSCIPEALTLPNKAAAVAAAADLRPVHLNSHLMQLRCLLKHSLLWYTPNSKQAITFHLLNETI